MGWILRASVTVLWLMLVAKLMGQRETGRMNMFDFVVAITIGSVASSHLADSEVPMMGVGISGYHRSTGHHLCVPRIEEPKAAALAKTSPLP